MLFIPKYRRLARCSMFIDQRGASAIEFAIVAPLLALFSSLVIDLVLAVRGSLAVESAAAAGAYYAIAQGWDDAAISMAVVSATDSANISATPAPSLSYGCPNGIGISAALQTTTCSDGLKARSFVTVNAAVTRASVFPTTLGLPATLQASVTVQLP